MRDIGDNSPRPVMMGHSFNNFQDINHIDPAAVPILEESFQMDVEKDINRKDILEMEEDCEKNLPSLFVPNCHAIIAWLSARLEKQKNKMISSGAKNTKKNEAERKQHNAAEI